MSGYSSPLSFATSTSSVRAHRSHTRRTTLSPSRITRDLRYAAYLAFGNSFGIRETGEADSVRVTLPRQR